MATPERTQDTAMSLLAATTARKCRERGDAAGEAKYLALAEQYRWTPRSRVPATPRRARSHDPQPRPGARYMTERQRDYLADLIAPRPPEEQEAILTALNTEWQAHTLTTGRASAWISHLLAHPSVTQHPESAVHPDMVGA